MSLPPEGATGLATDAWRQGLRALAAMPILAVSTLALELLIAFVALGLGFDVEPSPVKRGAIWLLQGPIATAIVASMMIAVHRFVVLDEVADRTVVELPPGYVRFVGWLMLIQVVLSAATLVFAFALALISPKLGVFVAACSGFVIVIVQIRLLTLFPAIAVERSAARAKDAWNTSRGHVWAFIGISMLTVLPLVVVAIVVLLPLQAVGFARAPGALVVMNTVAYVVFVAVAAALASRFYQIHATAPDAERLPSDLPER